ncbi:hypothetical protein ACM25O_14275 [Sulfitobacter pontiacus]
MFIATLLQDAEVFLHQMRQRPQRLRPVQRDLAPVGANHRISPEG